VGFEQTVDELVDVGQGQRRRRMRIDGGFGGSVVAVVEREDAAVLGRTLARIESQGWIVEASEGASPRRTDSRPGRA
jgi:galactokinase